MEENKIYKYLSGTLTEEEKKDFEVWLNASPDNQQLFFDIKVLWHARKLYTADKKDSLTALAELNKRIDSQEQKKRTLIRRWWEVAAAIVLLVGISIYLIKDRTPLLESRTMITQYNAWPDSVMQVTLPDGSTVWLNHLSKIEYPGVFSATERSVELEGEAFFDITSNRDCPFVVKTATNMVKVLGTSFNVNSNAYGNANEVILLTGIVQVQRIGGKDLITLHPGQRATYYKESSAYEVEEVDGYSLTSWRYGIVTLNEVSIQDIIHSLEKEYNISIQLNTTGLEDKIYNFSFKKNKGSESALHQLELMTGRKASSV